MQLCCIEDFATQSEIQLQQRHKGKVSEDSKTQGIYSTINKCRLSLL